MKGLLLTPRLTGPIPAKVQRWAGDTGRNRRLHLMLSPTDRHAFDVMPKRADSAWVTVTDLTSGVQLDLRPSTCGLGCFCDAEAKTTT